MKKATITFITSAALAFAIPLYAADEPGMKSDSQHKEGVTQQGMKSDSQQKEGMAQQGMKSDSQQKEGMAQQGMKSDSQQKEGMAQQGMKSDPQQKEGMAQQSMKSDSRQKEGLTQQQTDQTFTAEELKGMAVISQEGEEIGEIKKVTIDKQSGEVQFITISQGGILGIGDKEIAAPLSAFEFRDEQARLTVNQSKLENVPQKTAEASDSDYQRDLETHYGIAPAWGKKDLNDTTRTQRMDQDPTQTDKVDAQNAEPRKDDTQN